MLTLTKPGIDDYAESKSCLLYTSKMIAKLKNAQGEATAERDRIEGILRSLPQSSSPEKVGANIVAGSELELLRSKVASLLKEEQKSANETNQ